jgi:lipopolysaccharide transport system permease protein
MEPPFPTGVAHITGMELGPAVATRRYLVLLRSFVIKDIRTRYVGSLMGFFWSVIQPLIELLTYTFVFTVILRVRFEPGFPLLTNALYLFAGMVPWLTLSETLNRSTNAVRTHAHLVKKARFPSSALCGYIALSEAFSQLVRFALLFLAALIIRQGLSWHALLVLPVLVFQLLFTLGLSQLLATTQVFFKDTQHLLGAGLMIWLFITPIFYPASLFPKVFSPILMLNPLSHLVGIYRELILNHRLPHGGSLVIFGTAALLTFGIGAFTFQRHARRFPDLV